MQKFNSNTILKSLNLSAPSWPLQNTVAVNPFWFNRDQSFYKVTKNLGPILNTSLYMPYSYYKDAIESGKITKSALQESINSFVNVYPELPISIEAFLSEAESTICNSTQFKTISQLLSVENDMHQKVIQDFGKYASAYLDEKQAISLFPWKSLNFWAAWLQAQKYDRSMEFNGFKNFKNSLNRLQGLSSENGIEFMLKEFGIESEQDQSMYLQSTLTNVLGWSSQFKYIEWQKQLGYDFLSNALSADLLAVRVAYDYGVFFCLDEYEKKKIKQTLISNLNVIKSSNYFSVLQFALELSYQKNIVHNFNQNLPELKIKPKAQLIFCIDVRSEMLRRNIEEINVSIQTIGFAGFFGIPFDYKSSKESSSSHRLPVLLSPVFEVEEVAKDNHLGSRFSSIFHQISSFFRNLRKNPLSSFLYVELFGAIYIEMVLRRSFLFLIEKMKGNTIPNRFNPSGFEPSQTKVFNKDGTIFDTNQKIERAEAVLRHMGICESFANIVLILGHGSFTTNNAFGSSLDCGACGGHAGDLNARFLSDLLNDPLIRKGLELKGIHIPSSTQFIAGVHETVSDQIYILDFDQVRTDLHEELNSLLQDLKIASKNTSDERFNSKPKGIDPQTSTRSRNWSEIRPEWGLAGNACFIIAPRSRTLGMNLNGRSFLHDYDWNLDKSQGYKTLELIMTAPMIVTNWINLQYYASTVAPTVFGSGNKVLHNLVNETGVYEGNGGDLRIGLPLQSIHDGEKFVHDPLRLSVFIEAPREQIELLIVKHEVVRELVDHEWLHLIHLDSKSLKSERRTKAGIYVPV